jgi:hypothetical protein
MKRGMRLQTYVSCLQFRRSGVMVYLEARQDLQKKIMNGKF